MRYPATILLSLTFGQLWSQSADNYVKAVEKQWRAGKLTEKSSDDKMFVGSVTVYCDKDSVVLINSLTDAEASGTETLYYIRDGVLQKVFIMNAYLGSNTKWAEYYAKHVARENCHKCHGNYECFVAEITFGDEVVIKRTENGKPKQLTEDDKEKMLRDIQRTYAELRTFLKALNSTSVER